MNRDFFEHKAEIYDSDDNSARAVRKLLLANL